MGFEPTRAEHNGLAVHRLNHSATSSDTLCMIHEGNLNHYLSLVLPLRNGKALFTPVSNAPSILASSSPRSTYS